MAKPKGPLDSIKAGLGSLASGAKLGSLASRLPFVKSSVPASPEPFSTIEDDTPLSDIVLSENAAPIGPSSKEGSARPDLKGILASIVGQKPVLIGLIGALAILVIIAVVAVAVTLPPKAPEAAKPFTKDGEALVRTWLIPPGDPLEPRIEMQRSETPAYTPRDAAKLGIPEDPEIVKSLAAKNDRAIRELYGTVP
jgi:hypothetical protein